VSRHVQQEWRRTVGMSAGLYRHARLPASLARIPGQSLAKPTPRFRSRHNVTTPTRATTRPTRGPCVPEAYRRALTNGTVGSGMW